MFRILFTVVAMTTLFAAPALSQVSPKQQKEIEKRESTGISNSEKQLGGQKRDRQISQQIFRHAHNRMRTRHYRNERYGQ